MRFFKKYFFLLLLMVFILAPLPVSAGFKLPGTHEVKDYNYYQPIPFYYVHRINRVETSKLPDMPVDPPSSK